MFTLGSHRTPTIQRLRLGADADGRLMALSHDVWEHTSRVEGVRRADRRRDARMMYAAPSYRDDAPPRAARRPGAVVDARAGRGAGHVRAGVRDRRARGRAAASTRSSCASATTRSDDPDSGKPWSSRNLVACLREGAERFGWAQRDPQPGGRRDGRWLVGTGVAARDVPALSNPGLASADRGPARRPLRGADRRDRHRHRHVDRADADRRRGARRRRRAGGARDRRHGAAVLRRARRLGRHHVVGRDDLRRGARPARRARRRAAAGRVRHRRRGRQPRRGRVLDARLRRALRRGPRRRRQRRGARAADARRRSPSAASSTRAPRARSSSAA